MNRITNLELFLDQTNGLAKEERTFGGISNVRYRIMLPNVIARTHEYSKGISILFTRYRKEGRILRRLEYNNMIFFKNIKLYSTSINGSVTMQCRAITQSSICRSEPRVVDDDTPLLLIESGLNEEKGKTLPHSNLSCEVVQSQKILEEASALLDPFKKRLERASRSVQKAFTLEKLARMTQGMCHVNKGLSLKSF